MRTCLVIILAGLIEIASATPSEAQNRPLAADEFIQSSSQLKTGERLIGRTTPGSGSQEMVAIDPRPVGNSVAGPSLADRVSAQRPGQYNIYPYPGSAPPTPNPTFRQTSFQSPLTNSNAIRTAQNCNCAPGTVGGFQLPANTIPSIQAAPLPAPQGRLYVPGTTVGGQAVNPPVYQVPPANLNYAQPPSGIGSGTWYQPFVAGTGAYQPVLNVRPMPAGTYLGQGIVGQPTAYVAGQTFRNVLRYIFP